jgi:hypothetical protein
VKFEQCKCSYEKKAYSVMVNNSTNIKFEQWKCSYEKKVLISDGQQFHQYQQKQAIASRV